MKIALGNDHIVTELKFQVKKYLESKGHVVLNVGTDISERTHYPIFASKVANLVKSNEADIGIVICGTGVGIAVATNKHKGIRCLLCRTPLEAKIAKEICDMNILALGGRYQNIGAFESIIDAFLESKFEATEENKKKVEFLNYLIPIDANEGIENIDEFFKDFN